MAKNMLTLCVLAALAFSGWGLLPCKACADDAQGAFERGNAACRHGDFDLAVRHYTDAIRLNPKNPLAHNNRAYAYVRKGESDKAIADYSAAIRLDPKYAKAYFFRGNEYEDKGDQDKAIADYTAAIRLNRHYAREYCDRAATTKEPVIAYNGLARPSQEAQNVSTALSLFVAPNGDDHNAGTIERPLATLYKAYQRVQPGGTINFRAGTYDASIAWSKSGTPTAPITIQAYNGEDVTLQSAEQYRWIEATDAAFGHCWKVTIPLRQVRYPGLQHTVWEDTVNAAANPDFQIWAIVKNGYMCAAMNAAADFAHPQSAPGLPLTDKGGKLIYDITWYDQSTKTLWFKPGPSHVTDPSHQLYVTTSGSGQFSLAGSYLKLNGLKFKYLCYFHQQDNPTGCDIHNCEIKHAYHGICGGGTRCTYTSLLIDKIGDWLTWRDGKYDRGYLAHCFYFNGSRCVVSNCFFGRSNKGGPIQNYPYGTRENVFDGNVLYNSSGGSIFMGSSKNYITNNISLQKTFGINPYFSMQGFTFANNYSEAAYPFGFSYQEAMGSYTGTFEKFAITGNLFNNTGGWIDYRGNIVDAKQCNIDANVYLGMQRWHVGLTQANPPATECKDCTSDVSYRAALQALPNCATWEKTSKASSAAPQFDFASFDAFLDSDPSLATVLLKTRRYVKGIVAPFSGAGPAISE
jgi:tetratricopeptide (TPR) repeat protein